MKKESLLVDHQHPLVRKIAEKITEGYYSPESRVVAIFDYVRDHIKFGFTPVWDRVKASEVIAGGEGYCVPKATLFVALCRAADIPARLHFGDIDLRIMYGIFPPFLMTFLPRYASHAWAEVRLDGRWKSIDSYINDRHFCRGCREALQDAGREVGFSLACRKGNCSCGFNFGEKGFAHMGAVAQDRGVWEDTAEFMASLSYRPLPWYVRLSYSLIRPWVNRRIARLRRRGADLLMEAEMTEEIGATN